MKKKIIFFLISIFLIFSFLIFFKSLNKLNLYEPKSKIEDVPEFSITTFLKKKMLKKKMFLKRINIIYSIFGHHGVSHVEMNILF